MPVKRHSFYALSHPIPEKLCERGWPRVSLRCLSTKGYYQCQHTPGLLRHVWHSIIFCLVIDFGIKVTNMNDMHHLKTALEEHYTVAVNWKRLLFCGVKLTWDYINRHVTAHMPGYIRKALTKFQHPQPTGESLCKEISHETTYNHTQYLGMQVGARDASLIVMVSVGGWVTWFARLS